MLTKEGENLKLKLREDLPDKVNWFQYSQISDIFDSDYIYIYGFKDNNSPLEDIILKIILKMILNEYLKHTNN